VDLVAGGGVDDVVRLGSVARHGLWYLVGWLVVSLWCMCVSVCVCVCVCVIVDGKGERALDLLGFMEGHSMFDVGGVAHGYIIVVH
jgi:hypothetical protein